MNRAQDSRIKAMDHNLVVRLVLVVVVVVHGHAAR